MPLDVILALILQIFFAVLGSPLSLTRYTCTRGSALEYGNAKIFAAQFVAVYTVRLPCLNSSRSFAAQNIYSIRDSLKMKWVYAGLVATKMVDYKPWRNYANE